MKQAKMTIEKRTNAFNPHFYGRFNSTIKTELTFEYEYLHDVDVLPFKFFLSTSIGNDNIEITIDGDFAPINKGDDEFSFIAPFDGGVFEVLIQNDNPILNMPKILWWESQGDFEDGREYEVCEIKKYGVINK